ncbi:MAG: hypothetical protein RL217_1171 [Pseudomonadota bacterium]|jgi:iron complex outermembrane receptor protein
MRIIFALVLCVSLLPAQAENTLLDTVLIQAGAEPALATWQQERLFDAQSASLGETLSTQAGMQNNGLPTASRPVWRGLEGSRLSVLENQLGSNEVANLSQDHGLALEPFLLDDIRLLDGVESLAYSAAIGGVVRADTGRIARAPVAELSGRLDSRVESASQGHSQLLRLDGGQGALAWHMDGLYRQHQDYDTSEGRADNSFVHTKAGALASTYHAHWGYVGLAWSQYRNDYGLPAHEHDHDAQEPEHEDVHLPMRQDRYELEAKWLKPGKGLKELELALMHSDYQHDEVEGEEVATSFNNRSQAVRLAAHHLHQGQFGLSWQQEKLQALGEESFIPATRSQNWAAFAMQRLPLWAQAQLNMGLRVEQVQYQPEGHSARRFSPLSAALALGLALGSSWRTELKLEHKERAPNSAELYAKGLHHASHSYETGDASLALERALHLELGLYWQHQAWAHSTKLYRTDFDNYIHLADTLRPEIEEMLQRDYVQQGALFYGVESELSYAFTANFSLSGQGEWLRGQLKDGQNLKLMPQTRLGVSARYQLEGWRFSLSSMEYLAQRHLGAGESASSRFNLVQAQANWQFYQGRDYEAQSYMQLNNLLDAKAHPATSQFKEDLALPGCNAVLGVRLSF